MFAFLAPLLLRFPGISGAAKGLVGKIPRQVWEALAVLGYAFALYVTHQQAVRRHDAAIVRAEDARLAKQALALKGRIDALAVAISTTERRKNDEAHSRIDAHAQSLLVHGAGKASCSAVAGTAPGADQRPVRTDEADAPVPRLPDPVGPELIAMPFAGAVAFGRQNDQCIADLHAYEQRDELIDKASADMGAAAALPVAKP